MSVEVILGLPYLSAGPMTQTARRLGATVLLSASAFCRYTDVGPMPARWLPEGHSGARGSRAREWSGWNTQQLVHAQGMTLDLDSAGFTSLMIHRGYDWTPAAYISQLCTAYPWRRFSSLDLCVEPEIARDRAEVRERIAKTVALNRECRLAAEDAGIADRLMPVIQGANAEDYLRCFDAMSAHLRPGMVIGVGSMCRRNTGGEDGIIAIVERLDREIPKFLKFHIFGCKGQGLGAIAHMSHRVASIDSQAYGVRARQLAMEERRRDPSFSKSNAFVAKVMENWWENQIARMNNGAGGSVQNMLPIPAAPAPRPATVWDALELRVQAETNALIMSGDIGAQDISTDHHHLAAMQLMIAELPAGVGPSDAYAGIHQLPESVQDNWPCYVDPDDLHPSIRPVPTPLRIAA
jgi:hypothetical protein